MNNPSDIAKISVSGRAVKLLGRSLYSSHPMVILVRELMQNSRDAAIEKGVSPDIRFAIHLFRDRGGNRWFQVTGTDNGTGMTSEVILDKFLTLGDTSKSAEYGNVGGLGIAAASILSADEWSLETLNYSITSAELNAKPINIHRKVLIDGTRIQATFLDAWSNYQLSNTIRMLAFSELQTHLQIYLNDSLVYDHALGGIDITQWTVLEETDRYVISGSLDSVDVPEGSLEGSKIGGSFKGESFVRVGGLVQFREGSQGQRDTNILIDLINLPEAGTDEYPLGLSREELRDSIRTKVYAILRSHNNNPLTSVSVIRHPEADFTILDGRLIPGSAEEDWMIQTADRAATQSDGTPQPRVWVESAFQIHASLSDHLGGSPLRIKTILKDYKYKAIPGFHWRLLLLWAEIIRIVAPDNEEFGVGLTTGDADALRITTYGDVFYVINPGAVKGFRGNALITRLYFLAVHEVGHLVFPDHSERFTTQEQDLVVRTCQKLEAARTRLLKVFNQREQPSWLVPTTNTSQQENRLI